MHVGPDSLNTAAATYTLTTDISILLIDGMLNILAFFLEAICHQDARYTSTDSDDSDAPIVRVIQCSRRTVRQGQPGLLVSSRTYKLLLIVDMMY